MLLKFNRELFWSKAQEDKETGCIEWQGRLHRDGYGAFDVSFPKATWSAHRLSYFLYYGSIDKSLCICHHCDNRKCINPLHLFQGTILQNNQDRHHKGRSRGGSGKGFEHNASKVTPEDVLFIRTCSKSLTELQQSYDLSLAALSKIRRKLSYSNFEGEVKAGPNMKDMEKIK